jgi:hypothetical protein
MKITLINRYGQEEEIDIYDIESIDLVNKVVTTHTHEIPHIVHINLPTAFDDGSTLGGDSKILAIHAESPRVVGKIDLDSISRPTKKYRCKNIRQCKSRPKPATKHKAYEAHCANGCGRVVDDQGDWCYSCGELDEG